MPWHPAPVSAGTGVCRMTSGPMVNERTAEFGPGPLAMLDPTRQ